MTIPLLLINTLATFFLSGLIWFVQIVHYPLFQFTGGANFKPYHQRHTQWTGYVVIVPMLVELGTSALLLRYHDGIAFNLTIVAFVLVIIIWLSTFLLQVPAHSALSGQKEDAIIARLVRTNWIRTVSWSIKSLINLFLLWNLLNNA